MQDYLQSEEKSTKRAGMLTVNTRHVVVVNKIDRPNKTLTVRGICRFAVYFLVFRPFCRFTLVYEGHFVLCYKEKNYVMLDRATATLRGHRSA